MFNYEKIINSNVRIHCDTEEKANKLLKFMHDRNHVWWSYSPLININHYNVHGKKTTYDFSEGRVTYGDTDRNCGRNVISYEDILINFKVDDNVSMIFWAEDMMIVRGRVIFVDVEDNSISVQNLEKESSEYLEIDDFDLSGNCSGDNYRMIYHGWNVTVDINGEEEPVRKKWVTCTKENTKINDTVRYIQQNWEGNVEYISMNGYNPKFMISKNFCDSEYYMSEFEIEIDA